MYDSVTSCPLCQSPVAAGDRRDRQQQMGGWKFLGAMIPPIGSYGPSVVGAPSSLLRLPLADTGGRSRDQIKTGKYTHLSYIR